MDVPGLESPPATILIIEDDVKIAHLLQETLEFEGYSAVVATRGEDGIAYAARELPQLVLLDLMLPGIDGFEVVQMLRANTRTAHIPVVVLSARHDVEDKVRALECANDYLTKPYDGDELLARIRSHLRNARSTAMSPLTGLPGGLAVETAINQCLRSTQPWAILYLDLDHFKAYNDVYGPLQGNELIRLLARVALESVRELGDDFEFVGHIGGDDFIIITSPERAEPLCRRVEARWDRESRAHYSPEDASRGTIVATDRQGRRQIYPLVSVSIGVVTNLLRPITTREEFSRVAAEVKRQAKYLPGSSHLVDQRSSRADDRPASIEHTSEFA